MDNIIALIEIDNYKDAYKMATKLNQENKKFHWYTYQRKDGYDLGQEIKDLQEYYPTVIVINENGIVKRPF